MRQTLLICTSLLTLNALWAQRLLPVGSGADNLGIAAMVEYSGELILGGFFGNFNDHARRNIQGWDGGTGHNDLAGAFDAIPERVSALAVFEGDLIAAGRESTFGNIARWNGSVWSAMGSGLPQRVAALCVHNDELYAAGLDSAVSRWNGTDWEQVGGRFNGPVNALASFSGNLYAGGGFTQNDEDLFLDQRYLSYFNGESWQEGGSGLNGPVNALLSAGDELFVGGDFNADAFGSGTFPKWTRLSVGGFSDEPHAQLADAAVEGIAQLPDGRVIIGGASSSLLVDGNQARPIRFGGIRAAGEIAGRLIVGGDASTQSYAPVNRIGELAEGLDYAELTINNIRPSVTPTPALFSDPVLGGPGYETDSTTGKHTVFSASPWVTGYSDGVLHSSTPKYNETAVEGSWPWAGPTADVMDADFYRRWYQVWKVSADDIAQHIQFWDDPGYEMPYAIATWPGNGEPDNGEPALIAPFADLDYDGLYEPASGEYPIILGDQAIWYILHSVPDPDGLHPGMALDLHVMHRGIQEPFETDIFNTVFTNYQVINRSPDTYTEVRFAEFMDFDIGCFYDDRIGCDSTLHMYYGYNGDDFDEDCNGGLGFGNALKAQGVMYLNQALTAHRDAPTGLAVPLEDLMNGTQNGQPFTEPGYPTHFQYPGGSWTQTISDDQRAVGSIGPFELQPGDTLCVDMAHTSADAVDGLTTLLAYAANVQATYPLWNAPCFEDFSTGVDPGLLQEELSVFPNPSDDHAVITLPKGVVPGALYVFDALGKKQDIATRLVGNGMVAFLTGALPNGVYLLRSGDAQSFPCARLTVQH